MKKRILLNLIFFFIGFSAFSQEPVAQEEVGGVMIYNCTEDEVSREYGYKQYLKGIKYFNEKKYALAAEHFTKAMGKIHDDQVYLFRGRSYMHHGQYEKAIDDFLTDEKAHPHRASLDLARTYAAKGDVQKTIHYLKENLNSSYKKNWSSIANDKFLLLMKNDPVWQYFIKEQVVTEQETMVIDAGNKFTDKQFPEALSFINKALEDKPDNADWYGLRAKIKLELKQYDDAVKDYKKELRLDANRFNEVYRNIAIIYTRKGDLKKASLLLNEIVKNDSSQFFLLLDIAEIELERYDTEKAMDAVNRYLTIMPDDDEAYYIRANIGDGDAARMDINSAISICKAQNKTVPPRYYELQKTLK